MDLKYHIIHISTTLQVLAFKQMQWTSQQEHSRKQLLSKYYKLCNFSYTE